MARRNWLATAVLVTGLSMTAAAQAVMPVLSPLFDGVVVSDPYRFLSPPPGGDGSPTSAADTIPVSGGSSPAFAVYTGETPPQAELLANGGELAIGAATTAVKVTIDPVAPPADASGGTVAGNVYRIRITDQSGTALALAPGQMITLAMRGPAGVAVDATIARLVGGTWQRLQTSPSGLQDLFLAVAPASGDFALLGATPPPPSGFDPRLLLAALAGVGLVGLLVLRYRPVRAVPQRATSRAKRRGSGGRRRP